MILSRCWQQVSVFKQILFVILMDGMEVQGGDVRVVSLLFAEDELLSVHSLQQTENSLNEDLNHFGKLLGPCEPVVERFALHF